MIILIIKFNLWKHINYNFKKQVINKYKNLSTNLQKAQSLEATPLIDLFDDGSLFIKCKNDGFLMSFGVRRSLHLLK